MHTRVADRIPLVALILAVTALAGCASQTSAAGTFTNPVFKSNFPDPFVLKAGSTYYAYATNNGLQNVQEIHSRDLVHWQKGKDALPIPARWAKSDVWAPEVLRRSDGKYVLYYSAKDIRLTTHCLGRGVSSSPAGPFRDTSSRPFICQPKLGGDIDPDVFKDTNGKLYLYWKSDGISIGQTDYIFAQRLSADGLRLTGKVVKIDSNHVAWEGRQIEAPTMWKHAGAYYLFYSGNMFDTEYYSTGYATCRGPLGPCTDAQNPILTAKCKAAGPGHQALITDAKGQTWIVYHAWRPTGVGNDAVGRSLWIDRLDWTNGKPVVHGPTCTPQPDPAT